MLSETKPALSEQNLEGHLGQPVPSPYFTKLRHLVWDMGAQKHQERVSEGLGHLSLPLQCLAKGITSPCGRHEALCPSLV